MVVIELMGDRIFLENQNVARLGTRAHPRRTTAARGTDEADSV
jgi:hypothetical protein